MSRTLRTLLFCFCGLLLSALLYFHFSSPKRFEIFCNELFLEEMSANSLTLRYTLENPEDYGITGHVITLGSFDIDQTKQKLWILRKSLFLSTISRGNLSKEQQQTFDLLKYSLKTEWESLDFLLLSEPLVPSIGIQSQLPVLLAEYRFTDEADVANYLTLLTHVPEYFDSLLKLEQQRCKAGLFTDEESVAELITYCTEFLASPQNHFLEKTFQERLENLRLPTQTTAAYLDEHTKILATMVFPAYESLKDFLITHKNDGTNKNGLYYFENGTDYYAWLLRSEVGNDRSFEEIEAMLDAALKKEATTIAKLTKDNPMLLEERQSIALSTKNPAGLTSYLSKRVGHLFPEIPEVDVEICDVPDALEPHLSPAFYLVPPLDDSSNNVVYLNNGYLNEGISFFTTLAHESYPGHLYQNVYETATNPHPVNRLLYFGGYTEGWATYAEQLSYQYAPISKDLASLLSATRSMTLNIYSHLDLYVHAYGWTDDQCASYLKKFGITGGATAHEMFLLVKQQPANYLKYYLGYLEICELRDRAKEALGDAFDLKEFHKFLLDYGPAPFEILEKDLNRWLKSEKTAPH